MKGIEARIEVSGRVQGVGFRNKVMKIAKGLGLKGSVINLSQGGVLIVAQGEEIDINGFVEMLRESPGFSKVEGVEVSLGDFVKEYDDFKIIREKNIVFDKFKSGLNLIRRYFKSDKKIENIPKHIVIIPDGNRRWARYRGLEPHFGHYKSGSYSNIETLFREAKGLGVECISVWGFSTENWKRSDEEKKALFDLLLGGVKRFIENVEKNKIKFKHVGRKDRLPKKLVDSLEKLEKRTERYDGFIVQLCLDYGGRDEIIRAVNSALESGVKKVKEEDFVKFLDTSGVVDPDLIIRTSGENRLSGFMPFQSVYAELYFSKVYFPDFGARELRNAVKEYSNRVRRYGGN